MSATGSVRAWRLPDVLDPPAASVAAAPAIPPPPSPPVFVAADLAAAHDQGFAEGMLHAERAGRERAAVAAEAIAAALAAASETVSALAQAHAAALAAVLRTALMSAFPALEARFGPAEAAAALAALLPGLAREPSVSVRIAPAGFDAAIAACAQLPEAARLRIEIEIDAALGDADIRIAWQDGAAVRAGGAIRTAVLDALAVLTDETVTEGNVQ